MMKKLGYASLAAASVAVVFLACGDGTGGPDITCSSDADCQVGEICHVAAGVCVQECTSSADCPDSAKKCEALSDTDSRMICKCSTDQLCQTGTAGATAVCSTTFEVCRPACDSDLDCPTGQSCDTSSGQCIPTTGGGDGGTDTCSWETCSTDGWTGSAGQMCNNGTCGAGPSCSGTGKSTCDDNSFCSGGSCGYPEFPTQAECENFYSGGHSGGPVWDPATGTGPVIYEVSEISHGEGTGMGGAFPFCNPGNTQWNIRIRAYRTDADWPATRAGLSGFFYVSTDGTDRDIVGLTLLRPNTGYNRNPSNPRDAEFQVNLCTSGITNSLQPGFYFTGGNEACRQL